MVPKWDLWFQQAGVTAPALRESVRLADTNMTIEAALLGQGVALARSGHVEQELASGSLVQAVRAGLAFAAGLLLRLSQGRGSAAARGQLPRLDAGAVRWQPTSTDLDARHEQLLMSG
jgi:DNA-binding transcriptional LysR family regulator